MEKVMESRGISKAQKSTNREFITIEVKSGLVGPRHLLVKYSVRSNHQATLNIASEKSIKV